MYKSAFTKCVCSPRNKSSLNGGKAVRNLVGARIHPTSLILKAIQLLKCDLASRKQEFKLALQPSDVIIKKGILLRHNYVLKHNIPNRKKIILPCRGCPSFSQVTVGGGWPPLIGTFSLPVCPALTRIGFFVSCSSTSGSIVGATVSAYKGKHIFCMISQTLIKQFRRSIQQLIGSIKYLSCALRQHSKTQNDKKRKFEETQM